MAMAVKQKKEEKGGKSRKIVHAKNNANKQGNEEEQSNSDEMRILNSLNKEEKEEAERKADSKLKSSCRQTQTNKIGLFLTL